MSEAAIPGWAYKVLAKRDVSLKQAAWAFGCAKKGSEEERLLLERFWAVVRAQPGSAAIGAQPATDPSTRIKELETEIECTGCGDTWSSGKPGVCPDCGVEAMLAPEGESDWTPCLTCWLCAHAHSEHTAPQAPRGSPT